MNDDMWRKRSKVAIYSDPTDDVLICKRITNNLREIARESDQTKDERSATELPTTADF